MESILHARSMAVQRRRKDGTEGESQICSRVCQFRSPYSFASFKIWNGGVKVSKGRERLYNSHMNIDWACRDILKGKCALWSIYLMMVLCSLTCNGVVSGIIIGSHSF